jgi:hypothetical protein
MSEKIREDVCYDDGMCVASGEYEGRARHHCEQGERWVSHDMPWLGFPSLWGIFFSQVCYYGRFTQQQRLSLMF